MDKAELLELIAKDDDVRAALSAALLQELWSRARRGERALIPAEAIAPVMRPG